MEEKKNILGRIYIVYLLLCVFGFSILFKVVKIQIVEGDHWKEVANRFTLGYKSIEAVRGNIFDVNGRLLATSLPYYDVALDPNADGLSDKVFEENIDSLALLLADLFKDKTKNEYKRMISKARSSEDRYLVLKKNVSHKHLQDLKKFPILRLGRFKGGFVYSQINKRERPFKILASRTIGYYSEYSRPIGLEGAFNADLKGIEGKRLMRKITGGVEVPVSDVNEIDPLDGSDLRTTIDINIQDVAEMTLMEQLKKHNAHHGCVILMEVGTGEIRAIANLTRGDSGVYHESFNWAIGSATEPGSTFKLVSLMAAMEDGFLRLDEQVDLENGEIKFYGVPMKDSHRPKKNQVTVKEVFEESSNVGISKIISKYYSKNPQQFVDRINKMGINAPLNLQISGGAGVRIKNTKDKDWWAGSLPFMSIGYESLLTPMQILTFYNAVANDGKMMRPVFVKELVRRGKTIKMFEPDVINPSICSKETIVKAKQLMEGVVENGTAKSLKNDFYLVAGKTGTAQIAKGTKGYKEGEKAIYQASFVGYFPADKPKYSCIVMVSAPSNDVYYGALVAGPVFKEVADKIYSLSLDIHRAINTSPDKVNTVIPFVNGGVSSDIKTVYSFLGYPWNNVSAETIYLKSNSVSDQNEFVNTNPDRFLQKQIVPDVTGMSIKDAVYLLENAGLIVKLNGSGLIREQSLPPGMKFNKGDKIVLTLS